MLAACHAFTSVSAHGSFTLGAAAIGIPQPVASRRVAALEAHVGGRLLDRSPRQVALTDFGRELLPSARRLVEFAEAVERSAEQARRRPLELALPEHIASWRLASLVADARRRDVRLHLAAANPRTRAVSVQAREVRASLLPVPPAEGSWSVALGVVGEPPKREGPWYLETLRLGRGDDPALRRRIWLSAEDDVPHVRDRLVDRSRALGLLPGQVELGASLVSAAATVSRSRDLLIGTAVEAEDLRMSWSPLGDLSLTRGYQVEASSHEDGRRLRDVLRVEIAELLGAEPCA